MHYLPQSIPVRPGFYRVIAGFCPPRYLNPNGPSVVPGRLVGKWAMPADMGMGDPAVIESKLR
jgi:hypothetical protein